MSDTCDYNTYVNNANTQTARRLPLYTKTLDECGKYLSPSIPANLWSAYSSRLRGTDGFICVPFCDTAGKPNPTCSGGGLGLNAQTNEWSIEGQNTNYKDYIGLYTDPGGDNSLDQCIFFDPTEKSCEVIDKACCGIGFGGSDGIYCDRLNQNKLFVMTCDTPGSRSECCNHGTCKGGICVCDAGYAGNCCVCATGYVKDTSGNCVPIPPATVDCCDLNSGRVAVVSAAQCQANVNQKPVASADQCWPSNNNQSWCVAASAECTAVNSLDAWNKVKDEPGGKLAANCDACFPAGKFWCDSNYACQPIDNYQKYQDHKNEMLGDCSTCFPPNSSWCSADGTQCSPIGSRDDWVLHDGDPTWRTVATNCDACFPAGKFWCDSSKSCPAQTVEPYEKGGSSSGRAWLWWSISGALAVVILMVCIFLLFRKNRS